MTSDVERVLRRACARFKTGIRKPFSIDGVNLRIDPDGHLRCSADGGPQYWREALLVVWEGSDPSRAKSFLDLREVTVESVWTAYLQSQVDAVHAL